MSYICFSPTGRYTTQEGSKYINSCIGCEKNEYLRHGGGSNIRLYTLSHWICRCECNHLNHVLRVNQPHCGVLNALIVPMGSTVIVAVHAFHVQQVNTVVLAMRRVQYVRQIVFPAGIKSMRVLFILIGNYCKNNEYLDHGGGLLQTKF